MNEDKSAAFAPNNHYLKEAKLKEEESIEFSLAWSYSIFTKTLVDALKHPDTIDKKNPDGKPIGSTVATFTHGALIGLDTAIKTAPAHLVRISRRSVRYTKYLIVKKLQDVDRYKTCTSCPEVLREVANNDLLQLVAINQFIINDLDTVEKNYATDRSFADFFNKNKETLDKKLKLYLSH